MLLENVKNLKTHNLGHTAKVITNSLRDLGYSVLWNIFNTSVHTDIPQNRERTFIVCFLGESDWELDFKSKSYTRNFSQQLPLAKSKIKKNFREFLEKDVDEKFYYKQDFYEYKTLKNSIKSKEL